MPRRRVQLIGTPMFSFCRHCGSDFPSEQSPLDSVCGDCLSEKYFRCDECGSYHLVENGRYQIQDTDQYVCSDCRWSSAFLCNHCGLYHSREQQVHSVSDGIVCESCFEEHYYMCQECAEFFTPDELTTIDYEDYCFSCAERLHDDSLIKCYTYKPHPIMHRCGHEELNGLVFGIELEMDSGHPRLAVEEISDCFSKHMVYFKEDGSLGEGGVELVTHPISPSLLFGPKGRNKIRQVTHIARSQNMKSHDSGKCGLHVHVNRDFFGVGKTARLITEYKFITIFDRFFEAIRIFARRRNQECERWAFKPNFEKRNTDGWLSNAKRANTFGLTDRYFAVNIRNENTIELRIFRGTLKYETLLATLQFVCGLCHFIKQTTPSRIDTINWYELCDEIIRCSPYSCRELEQYLYDKELAVKEA